MEKNEKAGLAYLPVFITNGIDEVEYPPIQAIRREVFALMGAMRLPPTSLPGKEKVVKRAIEKDWDVPQPEPRPEHVWPAPEEPTPNTGSGKSDKKICFGVMFQSGHTRGCVKGP